MESPCLLATEKNTIAVASTEIPEPGPGQLLLEALYTSISPGTELRALSGQQGDGGFPFIPGYSFVGKVVKRGPDTALAEGTVVFAAGTREASHPRMWGAHVRYNLNEEANCWPLPKGLDPAKASLAKLAAIAYRGICNSRPLPHDTVAVVGLGPIGMLSALLHHLSGARIICMDLSEERVALARNSGLHAVVPKDGMEAAMETHFPGGADIVVDATGVPAVVEKATALARQKPWGDPHQDSPRFLIQGSYPDQFTLSYRFAFMRELNVHFPRDNGPRDIQTVLRLMTEERLKVDPVLSDVRPYTQAPDTYEELCAAKGNLMTVAFKWD